MPRIVLFVPCEKLIIDTQTNNITLISVLHQISYRPRSNIQLPPDAAIPMQWDVVSVWQREDGDEGISFNQRLTLRAHGNENVIFERVSPWRFATLFARNVVRIRGFPIAAQGFLDLTLSYRRPESDWLDVTTFPLELRAEPTT